MLSLALLASAASAFYIPPSFSEWTAIHNKEYEATERDYRMSVYNANVERILRHNLGNHSWTMEANKFADLTGEEFSARYASSYQPHPHSYFRTQSSLSSAAPSSVDWTTKGAVTPIKNQGQCGSCWAFSTTGSVEGAWFLSNGTLVSLSEQQLVDCAGSTGNQGCNGGLMDDAFQYIINNGGITTEANYPYTAVDGTCNAAKAKMVAAKISSFVDVQTNSEAALEAAVAQQPISVAVEADQSSFQLYAGGVMTAACGTALDHGVLAVGYGTDSTGVQYWKVKNSWGADWGMNGYILLGKSGTYNGGAGQCGIYMDPSYPVV